MNACHSAGCQKEGIVYLETCRFNPNREETHWHCLEHAEQAEQAIVEENRVGNKCHGFSRRKEVLPIVGLPATECVGSDAYPCTVINVGRNRKKVIVQRNACKAAPGSDYFTNQQWIIDPIPTGELVTFTLRKNGRWVLQGGSLNCGTYLALGHRRAKQDPSF